MINFETMNEQELEQFIRARIPGAREAAARIGPLHSMWDSILGAERLLAGQSTLLRGDRITTLRILAGHFNGYEPKA